MTLHGVMAVFVSFHRNRCVNATRAISAVAERFVQYVHESFFRD